MVTHGDGPGLHVELGRDLGEGALFESAEDEDLLIGARQRGEDLVDRAAPLLASEARDDATPGRGLLLGGRGRHPGSTPPGSLREIEDAMQEHGAQPAGENGARSRLREAQRIETRKRDRPHLGDDVLGFHPAAQRRPHAELGLQLEEGTEPLDEPRYALLGTRGGAPDVERGVVVRGIHVLERAPGAA